MMNKNYLLIVVLSLLASPCFSLGLGEATLHSSLNQPLLISIPVLGAGELTLNELKAKIASPELFQQQGLERTYVHSSLHTRITHTSTHSYVVEIYTHQPFKEAWINFLLDLRWPKGTILKNVSLLIDLPK
jgi:pilus assembly protein FimV